MQPGPIILFDGICNLCNGTVQFLLRQDRQKILRFAALQSQKASELFKEYDIQQSGAGSFILIDKGVAYQESEAALALLRYLPWWWQWLKIFSAVPRTTRDRMYRFVARNRYRWFGKQESCMIPA